VGGTPAALITVTNTENGVATTGWLSAGGYSTNRENLVLDHNFSIAMFEPLPKRYLSVVEIKQNGQIPDTVQIEVNKPITIQGWTLYQNDYDYIMNSKQEWTSVSVLEAVSDSWLTVVYIGVFMVIAGAVYIFWIGKDIK